MEYYNRRGLATVVGSLPAWGTEIFFLPRSGNKTKHGVEFCHSKGNILKIAWGTECLYIRFSVCGNFEIELNASLCLVTKVRKRKY